MKNTHTFITLFTLALVSFAASAEVKMGYVNVQYIVSKSPQRVAMIEKVRSEFSEELESIEELRKEGEGIQENAKKNEATLSQQDLLEAQRKLENLQAQIQLKQKAVQEDSERRMQEEQQSLLLQIQQQIEAVRKEEGLTMIFNSSSLLSADTSLDISDKVIAKMNALGN